LRANTRCPRRPTGPGERTSDAARGARRGACRSGAGGRLWHAPGLRVPPCRQRWA
jgi:hypothetical protein